jgi:hypothetical protein
MSQALKQRKTGSKHSSSETAVDFQQSIRPFIPEDGRNYSKFQL